LNKQLAVVLLFIFSFFGHAFAQTHILTVCTFPMAPYTIRDAKGNVSGLEVDLARALVEEAGFEPVFVDYPWNRALEMLKHGALDILMTMSKTPEREAFTHFLGVSTHQTYVLFVRKENAGIVIETMDDFMKGDFLFGIRQNFFYSEEFNTRLSSDESFRKHFALSPQINTNLKRVKLGHLTGCIGDSILTGYQVRMDPAYKDLRQIHTPFFKSHPVYFGASRKLSQDRLSKLEEAYQTLKKKGVFDAIIHRYDPH
jgi:ABC-type amino acid transport substrate-binding protein